MDSRKTRNGIHILGENEHDSLAWNQFIEFCPDGSFYHRIEWREINKLEFGHEAPFLASFENGRINGVLPLVAVRSRLFGHILCSLPFVNYCGTCAIDETVAKSLVTRACDNAKQNSFDYLEIRGLSAVDNSLQTSTKKVSLTLDLNSSPDELWSSFTSKHRNNIRRVYKSGLRVESGHLDLLDAFYDVMCRSWRALGTPIYQKSYFERILLTFGDSVRIFTATNSDGQIVAVAFNGYGNDTVEGMWAGGLPEFRRLHANYVLYWEMMKHACEGGWKKFHLGRSTTGSGGEFFKKKWGAYSRQLYWQYFVPDGTDMPELNVDNPKYRLAIAAWKRLPIGVTRKVGPILAKSIP